MASRQECVCRWRSCAWRQAVLPLVAQPSSPQGPYRMEIVLERRDAGAWHDGGSGPGARTERPRALPVSHQFRRLSLRDEPEHFRHLCAVVSERRDWPRKPHSCREGLSGAGHGDAVSDRRSAGPRDRLLDGDAGGVAHEKSPNTSRCRLPRRKKSVRRRI